MQRIRDVSKENYWNYFILVARFLLAWTFLRYGYRKLTGGQFGLKPEELVTPLQDLNVFRLSSWCLFDHQPFKAFVGVSQIICGVLLLINRTVIVGVFMFIPIIGTILIIDITFMPPNLLNGFIWRLPVYIFLDVLILYHYKERMLVVWKTITQRISTNFQFPIMAILLEFALFMPKIIFELIFYPNSYN